MSTITSRSWTMHAIFQCQECAWEDRDYETARQGASRHARDTGHQVNGETGLAWRINEKQKGGAS